MNFDDPMAPKYITWAANKRPAFHRSDQALVRWAQARRMSRATGWMVDDAHATMVPCTIVRSVDGDTWALSLPGKRSVTIDADPLDDSWAIEIVDYMEENLTALNPQRVALSDWTTPDPDNDPLGLYAPFGFLPPVEEDSGEGPCWTWRYCPELIAAQTEYLDEDVRLYYLTHIDLRINLHPAYRDLEPRAREDIIDNAIYQSGPDQANIISEVQMRVLDAR